MEITGREEPFCRDGKGKIPLEDAKLQKNLDTFFLSVQWILYALQFLRRLFSSTSFKI